MALFTCGLPMFPFQGKFCFRVIETNFLPRVGIVTSFAVFPQCSLVLIFLLVASVTIEGRLAIFLLEMARGAFRLSVLSGQFEVGLLMIEPSRIELDHRVFSPLVLRMAGLAAGSVDLPVISLLLFDISLNRFMARKTFVKEFFLGERVAFQALPFRFLMKPGDLSGHDAL